MKSLFLLPLLGLSTAFSASAAIITLDLDNFESEPWSVMSYTTGAVHQPYTEVLSLHDETWLRIRRASSTSGENANSAQVIYNAGSTNAGGSPVSAPDNQLSDIRGSAIVGSSNWSADVLGFVLRAQGAVFNDNAANKNAYILSVNQSGGQSHLNLYWGVGNQFANSSYALASVSTTSAVLSGLTTSVNNQYFLEFSFIGNHLNAVLSEWDIENNVKGDSILTLDYTDTRPEARLSGYYGVRGGRFGSARSAYFREIQFEPIPEPSTAALLLLPAGALWLASKRRKMC